MSLTEDESKEMKDSPVEEESPVEQASSTGMQEVFPDSLEDLLQLILLLQMERAGIYKDFEEGFRQYLDGRDEVAYMRLCQSITAQFSSCSSRVNGVESALRDRRHGRSDLADVIRTVQGHEKRKLETTVILQVLRKARRPSERASSQAPIDNAYHACEGGTSNAHGGGACSHHVKEEEVGAIGVAEAEAESEYEAAYAGSVQILQEVIMGINDGLDDIRQAIDELS